MRTQVHQRVTREHRAGEDAPATPRVGRPAAAADRDGATPAGLVRQDVERADRWWRIRPGDLVYLHRQEILRQLLVLAGPAADREVISHRLCRFYAQAADCDIPEVHTLAEDPLALTAMWSAAFGIAERCYNVIGALDFESYSALRRASGSRSRKVDFSSLAKHHRPVSVQAHGGRRGRSPTHGHLRRRLVEWWVSGDY